MRFLAFVAFGGFAAAAVPAAAQTYSGAPLSPPALQQAIVAAVAQRLPEPNSVRVRDLVPSKARSGHGYCGFASSAPGAPFQPFHVLVEDGSDPAVLILPEKGDPPGLPRADAIYLLTNLGCLQ